MLLRTLVLFTAIARCADTLQRKSWFIDADSRGQTRCCCESQRHGMYHVKRERERERERELQRVIMTVLSLACCDVMAFAATVALRCVQSDATKPN